jgi:hypothetical protein
MNLLLKHSDMFLSALQIIIEIVIIQNYNSNLILRNFNKKKEKLEGIDQIERSMSCAAIMNEKSNKQLQH